MASIGSMSTRYRLPMKAMVNVGTAATAAPAVRPSQAQPRRRSSTTTPTSAANSSTVAALVSDADGVMVSIGYDPRSVASGP
jgi:hypothetical protein